MTAEPEEPDYVVLRPGDGPLRAMVPERLDGLWLDRNKGTTTVHLTFVEGNIHATAVPTGRFESRDDGAVAEVWEIRQVTVYKPEDAL